jgi:hypothetical protein
MRGGRATGAQFASDNRLGLRVGRCAALPRQVGRGIDRDGPWNPSADLPVSSGAS